MDLKSPIPRGAKVEFYSLPAHVKQKILSNLDTKNGPLFELQQQDLQPAEEPNAVEVTKLMDYWMCGIEMFTNNFVVAFEGPKPVIKDDLTEWNSWVMSTKHRLQFEDHQMEVPIALANYHFYEEKYNLFCSKLFLTAVTRFCEKNPRSYRFEVEVIGNKIIIEEAPVADAYLGGTYFDSALTKLTDRNEKRRMFELLKCEMGDFMCVYYSPVTLVDPEVKSSEIQEEEINEVKKPLNPEKKQTFEEGLKAFLPEIYTAEEFVDTCAKSFVVTYSKVSIVDGLRYKPPSSTIELIARRKDGFNPNSLLVRWPECFFSNSTGLATVLHSKGVVVEHPKIHKPVFPPSCKKHLSLASQLLQRLCKEIRSRVTSEDTKFSLVWLDDRETDGASQKMRLYKRMKPENAKRDASLFISDGMRKVVSRLKPRN
ncbi:hypothetical protein L596_027299 [Steinernema carpocapsae]|uniref:Decapping nuclease n=1 Tax=Steinernema carpocapsae TaxID=34508 RepID=A0A4U5M431_STECR|nr:hypothetical protein L596_027299 [Steinernema carpocapsae]